MFKFIGNMLRNVGRAIATVAEKVIGFAARAFKKVESVFRSGLKWVWNSKPIQWIWKSKPVQWLAKFISPAASWVWSVVSGPIGWVLAPILAIIFVPGPFAVVLFALVLAIAIVAAVIWLLWHKSGKPEDVLEPMREAMSGPVDIGERKHPLLDTETSQSRFDTLEEDMIDAKDEGEPAVISDLWGRMAVIKVRTGTVDGIRSNATPAAMMTHARMLAKADMNADPWDFAAMDNGVRSESKRWRARVDRKRKRDKAEKDAKKATPVASTNAAAASA